MNSRTTDDRSASAAGATGQEIDVPSWCRSIETVFLDLDGCTWFGEALADGAAETVAWLRARGKRVAFVTNVSNATRGGVAAKLTALGIPADQSDVLVPVELLLRHDLLEDSARRVFPFCARGVRGVMEELGISLTDDPRLADVVVVGRDVQMSYDDLAAATQALYLGARLLALNLDSRVPLADGVIAPGAGAIVASLQEATGAQVELIGKPSAFFFEAALEAFGAVRDTTVMVGDTLDSDILGGRRAGLKTILVGGSEYSTLADPPVPDLVLTGIADLRACLG